MLKKYSRTYGKTAQNNIGIAFGCRLKKNDCFYVFARKEVSKMKKIPFSTLQKNSIVSFLLVQLFALLFVAIFLFAVTLGSESTIQKKLIVQKELRTQIK